MNALRNFMKGKTIKHICDTLIELKVTCKKFSLGGEDYVLFNYSARGNPLVGGCRGTVWRIDEENYTCVRSTFDRFFNYGEELDEGEVPKFDSFETISIQEKEDGTLCIASHIGGKLTYGTRNLPDIREMNGIGGKDMLALTNKLMTPYLSVMEENKDKTFMWELCTPWNPVVVSHETPHIVLLGVRDNVTFEEYDPKMFGPPTPVEFQFDSFDECSKHVQTRDPELYEGFVLKWGSTESPFRLKLKSHDFVSLSKTSRANTSPEEVILAGIVDCDVEEVLADRGYWRKHLYLDIQTRFDALINSTKDVQAELDDLDSSDKKYNANYGKIASKSSLRVFHFQKKKNSNLTLEQFCKANKDLLTKILL